MANSTTPNVGSVPKWAWIVLLALCFVLLLSGAIGHIFFSEPPKDKAGAPQAITQPTLKQQSHPAETEKRKEEGARPERFLVFALLGVILLGIAFIPRLPAGKFLGGVGALLLLFGLIMSATFWAWPELEKKNPPPEQKTTHRATRTPATVQRLPANAKFVKTLTPGERIYLTRTNMDASPPERWAKFSDGQVAKFAPWPANAQHRYAENTIGEPHDLYVVLPPGQGYTKSLTDPALGQQIARASTAQRADTDCLLDRAFPK